MPRMLLSGVALGIGLGLVRGGRLERLGRLELKSAQVLVMAVLARALAPFFREMGLVIDLTALAGIVAWGIVNRRLPGAAAVAVGASLNFAVVFLNSGMPVGAVAILMAGAEMPGDPLHVQLGPDTRMPLLADVLPFGLFRSVYSVGDVVLALGGFLVPYRALRIVR